MLSRFVLYLGLALAVGADLVAHLLGPELTRHDTRLLGRPRAAGVAAAALATLLVPVQVARQLGYPVQALAPAYLVSTRQGRLLALRLALLAGLAAAPRGIPGPGPGGPALRGLLAVGIVVTVSLTGHAGARADLLAAHLVHLLGVLSWGGGLAVLAWLPDRPGQTRARVEAIQRFSRWASAVFPVLLAAGAYLGVSLTGAWRAWVTSSYGRWLMIKVVTVALLSAAAGVNRWRRLPLAMRAAPDQGKDQAVWRRLRRSVQLEAFLLVVVLALTAALSGQAPPALQGGG